MSRLLGIALILATLWLGMKLWTQGLSGLSAPAEAPDEELAQAEQADEQPAEPVRRQARPRGVRVPITEYVRDRTSRDIQRGAERHGQP